MSDSQFARLMRLFTTINPRFAAVSEADVVAMTDGAPAPDAVLHRGRNSLWRVSRGDTQMVVKRFAAGAKSAIIYAVASSKARRSYTNALALLGRGIATPVPVAYMERRGTLGLLADSAYICLYEPTMSLEQAISRHGDVARRQFAAFAASMHAAGVCHRDLNNTNVRVVEDADTGRLRFSLIDLNRMRLYDGPVPDGEAFADLCRFCSVDDRFAEFAAMYASARGLGSEATEAIIAAKRRHDRRHEFKYKLKHIFR